MVRRGATIFTEAGPDHRMTAQQGPTETQC